MKSKVISAIQAIIGFGSFLYLVGLVGSVDLGRITLGEFFGKAWFLIFVPTIIYILNFVKSKKENVR